MPLVRWPNYLVFTLAERDQVALRFPAGHKKQYRLQCIILLVDSLLLLYLTILKSAVSQVFCFLLSEKSHQAAANSVKFPSKVIEA